jgi:hypothetical protein
MISGDTPTTTMIDGKHVTISFLGTPYTLTTELPSSVIQATFMDSDNLWIAISGTVELNVTSLNRTYWLSNVV